MTTPHTRDPGLQPERTRLAWRRTTLTWTVTAALVGRQALTSDALAPTPLLAGTVAALLAFWLVAHRRIAALCRAETPRSMRPNTAVAASAAVLALAALTAAQLL
ncbi:DUF202 domain-containing protein [Streptomyces sp. VB1]|uniref:DUF202 domain-containing protein n=1 Tax=Streptomyces sp. VB1 TaxID=2986803 RepID=UPI002241C8F1|nr:DUF202 domain-containing protein [Streptomyces sp. VB1]UZI32796.1 DUF202 domain-containing protein [Streptomyces sp. VB1]